MKKVSLDVSLQYSTDDKPSDQMFLAVLSFQSKVLGALDLGADP